MNADARLVARINAVYDRLTNDPGTGDHRSVLTYIRGALTPEAVAARDEDDRDVTHLHQVAKSILRGYEREAQHDGANQPEAGS